MVGDKVGLVEGAGVGSLDGLAEGLLVVGALEGARVGLTDGDSVGATVGEISLISQSLISFGRGSMPPKNSTEQLKLKPFRKRVE